jgi:hypothetical protein
MKGTTMQTAHIHLIKYALSQGCTVSVYDGEEWPVKNSQKLSEILDVINSVDESMVRIKSKSGDLIGNAYIIDQGTPDETVSDYSSNEWFDTWSDEYEATISN